MVKKILENLSADTIENIIKEKDKEISKLEKKNQTLRKKLDERLPPSQLQRLVESKDSFKEQNKQKNEEIRQMKNEMAKIKKQHETEIRDIKNNFIPLGAFSNNNNIINGFPGADSPIFKHFYELVDKYPNKDFIKKEIKNWVYDKYKAQIKRKEYYSKQAKIIKSIENKKEQYGDSEDLIANLSSEELKLYEKDYITPQYIKEKLEDIKKNSKKINNWNNLIDNIEDNTVENLPEIINKDYYLIKDEFDNIFELISYAKSPFEFQATIFNNKDDKSTYVGKITRELEKQMGFRKESDTKEIYFHDGDGKMIPLSSKVINIHKIVVDKCYLKQGDAYIDTNFISSKTIYEDIPSKCNINIKSNLDIVTFKNGFYEPKTQKFIPLNPHVPLLGYRQCNVNFYPEDVEIDGGALKDIITQCFSEIDQKIILAYVGCMMFDKGYVNRQESLFLLSKGGLGKTTLIRDGILKIFSRVSTLQPDKLNKNNRFSYSEFDTSDVVMLEEVQSGTKDFVEKLKQATSGNSLQIEKKNMNTFPLPGEKVPRLIIDGNNLPKDVYHSFAGAGALRRILIVIPTKNFRDLGYITDDIKQQNCLEWLVQQATKVYHDLGLHIHQDEIGIISEEEKLRRIDLTTFPEECFLQKHFEIAYTVDMNGYETIDNNEYLYADDIFDFLNKQIDEHMLEKTNGGNIYELTKSIQKVFNLRGYNIITKNRLNAFPALVPASKEAIEFFKEDE